LTNTHVGTNTITQF